MHDKNWTIFSMADIFVEKVHYGLIFLLEKINVFYIRLFAHKKIDESSPQPSFFSFFFDIALDPSFRVKIDQDVAENSRSFFERSTVRSIFTFVIFDI